MIWLIVRLQLISWWRDRRLAAVLGVAVAALTVVSAWSTYGDVTQREAHTQAAASARQQWEGRGPAHPHSMAHFGDFAFRPSGPLARLDRGVQARLGKVLRIEGHRQGTPLHADAARAGTVARFPRPDAAFVLHLVVPLLLIFLGAMGLAADRESGRLRLTLVQGVGGRALVSAHVLALWGLGLGLLCVVVVASWGTSVAMGTTHHFGSGRLLAFIGLHSLFLAVVAVAIVAASVWSRSGRSALLSLLAAWVVGTAVLPRATSSVANAWYPLPSRDAFQAEMREAREQGPDGHNPKDTFVAQRRQEVLQTYGVDTVEELPINFDGVAMQLDEEFANRIWDEHYGALETRMARQLQVSGWGAMINPFQAVDHVSMAVAGTDLLHDFEFRHQAEAYRRTLIGQLNHEHAYGGSKTGDRTFKATPEFFASLEPFHYVAPSLSEVLRHRMAEIVSLLGWLLVLCVGLFRGGARLERGTLKC